jgi:hypothetical protein
MEGVSTTRGQRQEAFTLLEMLSVISLPVGPARGPFDLPAGGPGQWTGQRGGPPGSLSDFKRKMLISE